MIICPKCHEQNEDDHAFCLNCGSPLEKKCPSCGRALTPKAKFCPGCGATIQAEAKIDTETNVTLMSVDIQGSTEWISDKDVEQAYELIEQALEVMAECVTDYYGHILALTGDGIAAFFEGENHALQACFTAATMQQKLLSLKLPFHVRVGIHSSQIETNQPTLILENDAFKTAQTLEAKAPPDGIQISYTVRDTYQDLLKTGDQESIPVPGKLLPMATYTLRDIDPSVEALIRKPASKEGDSLEGFIDFDHVVDGLGEHKFITTCFIKISSTQKTLDEKERTVINTMLNDSISEFGGTFIKQVGETTLTCYGAPVAYEDHVLRACLSSYFLLQQITDYQVPLDIRIGIHSGEAVVNTMGGKGYRQYDLVGASVNLAARLMQTASGDQIQISEETLKFVEPYIQTISLGLKNLKGIKKPVQVYSLTGINRNEIRKRLDSMFYGDSPFIGRQKEIELFKSILNNLPEKKGYILAIKAEPGVGKTRLLYELSQLALKEEMIIFSVSSLPYEQSESFSSLRLLMQNIFGISARNISPIQLNSIRIRLREVHFSEELAIPSILTMLRVNVEDQRWEGLAPILQEKILFKSTLELLESFLRISPLIVIFEDLHWCDQDSLRFLTFFASSIQDLKMLLLLDYRSTFTLPEELKGAGQEYHLEPLNDETSKEFIESILPGNHDLNPLKNKIIEITKGNPYFIEEYVKTLITNENVIKRDHAYVLANEPDLQTLPNTIGSLINSEVDKLPKSEKILLQQASVLGNVFDVSHLRLISTEPEEEFNMALTKLSEKGYFHMSEMIGHREYTFKHNYLCDTVSKSLLKKTRNTYHKKLVEEIELDKRDELPKYYTFLAKHCYEGELWKKAIHYYNLSTPAQPIVDFSLLQKVAVGKNVQKCYAQLSDTEKNEIINEFGRLVSITLQGLFFTNEIEEAMTFSDEMIREFHERNNIYYEIIINTWTLPMMALSGNALEAYEQTHYLYSLLKNVVSKQEKAELQLEVDVIDLQIAFSLGKYEEFDRISKRLKKSTDSFRDAMLFINPSIGSSSYAVGNTLSFLCNKARARPQVLHQRALETKKLIDEEMPISEFTVHLVLPLGFYYWLIGSFDEATHYLSNAYYQAEQIEFHTFVKAIGGIHSLALYHQGEQNAALTVARKSYSLEKEEPYFFYAFGLYHAAEVLARSGEFTEAIDLIENAIPIAENDREKPILAVCYRIKALIYTLMAENDSKDEEILHLLEKSQHITDEIGCNFQNPFIQLNYEEFFLRKGDKQKAEEHHNKALEYFKEYEMTGWYEHYSHTKKTGDITQ